MSELIQDNSPESSNQQTPPQQIQVEMIPPQDPPKNATGTVYPNLDSQVQGVPVTANGNQLINGTIIQPMAQMQNSGKYSVELQLKLERYRCSQFCMRNFAIICLILLVLAIISSIYWEEYGEIVAILIEGIHLGMIIKASQMIIKQFNAKQYDQLSNHVRTYKRSFIPQILALVVYCIVMIIYLSYYSGDDDEGDENYNGDGDRRGKGGKGGPRILYDMSEHEEDEEYNNYENGEEYHEEGYYGNDGSDDDHHDGSDRFYVFLFVFTLLFDIVFIWWKWYKHVKIGQALNEDILCEDRDLSQSQRQQQQNQDNNVVQEGYAIQSPQI